MYLNPSIRGLGKQGFPCGWAGVPPAVLSFLCPSHAVDARAPWGEGSFSCVRPSYYALHQSPIHSAQGCASWCALSVPPSGHLPLESPSAWSLLHPQAQDGQHPCLLAVAVTLMA